MKHITNFVVGAIVLAAVAFTPKPLLAQPWLRETFPVSAEDASESGETQWVTDCLTAQMSLDRIGGADSVKVSSGSSS